MTDHMDIYIRLNEDPEKDYCLNVNKNMQVKDLRQLFTSIPVILSPDYFHDTTPSGFKVSAHPGHLTAEGAVLFDWNADRAEYLVDVDQLAPIGEALTPGCLVIPTWRFIPHRYYGIASILLFWWYLDWPDWLSFTPGNQPTILLGNFLGKYSSYIREEVMRDTAFDGLAWDWLFFVFHTIKVGVIWLVFRVGIVNVRSLNPMKRGAGPKAEDITAETLMDLGWTGVRRMQVDDWVSKHRDEVIAEHDKSVIKAYASGKLKIKSALELQPGEGWAVLRQKGGVTSAKVGADFLDEDGKFVISEPYLRAIGMQAQRLVEAAAATATDDDVSGLEKVAKDLRRVGFEYGTGPEAVKKTYSKLEDERFPKYKSGAKQ